VVATHHERASRGGAVFVGDWARFATRWDRTLHAGDPYWSPHLLDEPQGEIRATPPSAAELALRSSRIPSDGPPTRPVRSPVRDDDRELRPSAERFVPETMSGSMIQAEHEARYRWAATIVVGKQVLDAGSGVGYGAQICSEAGAERVVGVDVSEHALADARALGRGAAAEFVVGDLLELPFPDRSFDVVVCFEAIEHVEDVERVLDELRRVLRDDGVLLISSPNRGVYPGGNPHHVHELTSDELSEALGRRFANIGLHRQSSWAATLIADDAAQRHSSSGEPIDGTMRKVVGRELGAELYTVAAASDAPLPRLGAISVMCDPVVSDPVYARIEYSEKLVTAADAAAAEARRQLAAAERELTAAEAGRVFAERVADDLQSSVSWRVTAPLRALKRLAANRRRAARAR
jgi:ubiquinone/menaquinone biosynthesis C-methylase UbiE